jgi:tetratricopeptide (TPR) repeat protein
MARWHPWLVLVVSFSLGAVSVVAQAEGDGGVADTTAAPAEEEEDPVLLTERITLTNGEDGQRRQDVVALEMRRSQDPAAAACAFGERYKVLEVDSVLRLATLLAEKAAADAIAAPAGLRLRTAGAHKKKAEELAKEGEHDDAAAHLIRALLRSGLDESMVEQLKRSFATAMQKLGQQRQNEAAEAAEAAAAEARRVEEALALQEARARAARDADDWRAYMEKEMARAERPADTDERGSSPPAARLVVPIRVSTPAPAGSAEGAPSVEVEKEMRLEEWHEDTAHAAYDFCTEHGLQAAAWVQHVQAMAAAKLGAPEAAATGTVEEHLRLAGQQSREGSYAAAGVHYARAVSHPDFRDEVLSEEERRRAEEGVSRMIGAQKTIEPFLAAVRGGAYEAALKQLEKLPREQRSGWKIQLLEARCNQMLGRWGNAQRAAARVVEATASYSSWERGQPRMLAVSLGTTAALEMGDGAKALGFLSTVLKYDPDHGEVRKQYRQLKEVVKLLERAEAELVKGYNHKAVKELDTVLAKLRGMDVGGTLLRAQVLLKLCRARSAMNKHIEAMEDCETAHKALAEPSPGVHVHPARVREALTARAQAHEADKNYDAAVVALRAALELVGQGTQGEAAQALEASLRRVLDLQRRWACVDPEDRPSWQQNRCGNPHDPAAGRDHRAVLELPANLGDLPRDDQCSWVSKQYRKLAKRWHPDRYRGGGRGGSRSATDKVRAERKMRECAEAKEVLSKQLSCGEGGGSKRRRDR